MRMFPLLQAQEIECRISEVKKTQKGGYVKLLLYKTARTDAALLDTNDLIGPFNWQCDYKTIDGKMYCGIGIKDPNSLEWVWKWNVGTESNQDADKGQASDALKRAGFVWGLGTELYSAPEITVWEPNCSISESNGKVRCYDRFVVSEIGYGEDERINRLLILNKRTGKVAFEMGAAKNKTKEVVINKPADVEANEEMATFDQMEQMFELFTQEQVDAICNQYNVSSARQLTYKQAQKCINNMKKRNAAEKGEEYDSAPA